MTEPSAPASPLNGFPWADVPRILLIGAFVGAVESLIGAFSLDDDPFVLRTLYTVVLNVVGAAYGVTGYWVVRRSGVLARRFWGRVLAADLLVLMPGALTTWASTFPFGGPAGGDWHFIAYASGFGFVLSGAFIAAFVAPTLDKAWECASNDRLTTGAMGPVSLSANFMDRLPVRLRGAELWALKAEDHYLRPITSRGEALIRMRLSDAVRELNGMEGARCHRSWWVARAAIRNVKRADGRVRFLVLPDQREIPVSRSYADDVGT